MLSRTTIFLALNALAAQCMRLNSTHQESTQDSQDSLKNISVKTSHIIELPFFFSLDSKSKDTSQSSIKPLSKEQIHLLRPLHQDTRPSIYSHKIRLLAPTDRSYTVKEMQSELTMRKFVPRWSSEALPQTKSYVSMHSSRDMDNTSRFTYTRPNLTGSAWDSIESDLRRKEVKIYLKNDVHGIFLERRLTELIHSIATQIDDSLKLMRVVLLPPQSNDAPFTVMELGLTEDELTQFRFIASLKSKSLIFHESPMLNSEKARQIFKSVTLKSDLAVISKEILELTFDWDQNQLGKQISEKLALLLFIHKKRVEFWANLYNQKRYQSINRFYNAKPTFQSVDRIVNSGTQLLAVLNAIRVMSQKCNIQRIITKVQDKVNQLIIFQKQMKETIQSQEIQKRVDSLKRAHHSKHRSSNHTNSAEKSSSQSLYRIALGELNITNKTPDTKIDNPLIRNTLSSIQDAIDINLARKKQSMKLNETLRETLLLQLDPSIKCCLTPEELTVYLGIFQASSTLMDVFVDHNGSYSKLYLSRSLRPGDNLINLTINLLEIYDQGRKAYRIAIAAVGKDLAFKTAIALAEHFFWNIAAEDEGRMLELKRFLDVNKKQSKIVKADIEVGQKLLVFFKGINSIRTVELIEKKLGLIQLD